MAVKVIKTEHLGIIDGFRCDKVYTDTGVTVNLHPTHITPEESLKIQEDAVYKHLIPAYRMAQARKKQEAI